MLFPYRPRQTWMPFASPRGRSQQAAYNRQLQERFASTHRRPRAVPAGPPGAALAAADPVGGLKELAALHEAGDLSDAEFQAAKAKLLAS